MSDFDGLLNARDVGGLPTAAGGRVQEGRLLRSADPSTASQRDLDRLERLQVRTVIDLRSDWEVNTPPPLPRGADRVHIPLVRAKDQQHAEQALQRGGLLAYYEVLSDRAAGQLAHAIDVVAQSAAGVLIHCHAGKDRTGTLVALLLGLVGVKDEAIARDYAQSSPWMRRIGRDLPSTKSYSSSLRKLSPSVFKAHEPTMRDFLTALRARHSTLERYASTNGVTSDTLSTLRHNLVAPRPPGDRDLLGDAPTNPARSDRTDSGAVTHW